MMEQGKEIIVITAIDTDSPNYSGDNVRPGDEIVKVSNKIVAGDYNAVMAALAEAKKGKSRTAACQVVRRNPPLQLDGKKAPSAAAPATPAQAAQLPRSPGARPSPPADAASSQQQPPPRSPQLQPAPPGAGGPKWQVGAKLLVSRTGGGKTPCTVLEYDAKHKAYKVRLDDGSNVQKMATEALLSELPPQASPPAAAASSQQQQPPP